MSKAFQAIVLIPAVFIIGALAFNSTQAQVTESGLSCSDAHEYMVAQIDAGVDMFQVFERDELVWYLETSQNGVANCAPVPANLAARYRGLPLPNPEHKRMTCHLAADYVLYKYGLDDISEFWDDDLAWFGDYYNGFENGRRCEEPTDHLKMLAKGWSLRAQGFGNELLTMVETMDDGDAALEIAIVFLEEGQPDQGLPYLWRAAELGSPWAYMQIAAQYREGTVLEQDAAKSHEYTLKAAEAGLAWGMVAAGRDFETGYGTRQDHAKALEWYRRGASQGNLSAVALAANLIYSGKGKVDRDEELAFDLLRTAAGTGDTNAMVMLGGMLLDEGNGIRHEDEAFDWLYVARSRGSVLAADFLDKYEDRVRGRYASVRAARERAMNRKPLVCNKTVNHCVNYVPASGGTGRRICNSGRDWWGCSGGY